MEPLLKKNCMIGALGGVWSPGKLGIQKSRFTLHALSICSYGSLRQHTGSIKPHRVMEMDYGRLKAAVWACMKDSYNLGYWLELSFPCVPASNLHVLFFHGVLYATTVLEGISLGRAFSPKIHLM